MYSPDCRLKKLEQRELEELDLSLSSRGLEEQGTSTAFFDKSVAIFLMLEQSVLEVLMVKNLRAKQGAQV